ncbi:hypothetical protein ARMGADRAFT_1048466 [Armillaria gallica]|uniref:CxC2-like cysteine cluster KDZ transposase-associated domain-containing protein n=1 Tax=Armillaria gallica TaxID=47427 RepID=A0A2H3CJR7_ARMGA|nr:hypothetical protein ARMGADRAFT_1048466 [Armillaria gallica]
MPLVFQHINVTTASLTTWFVCQPLHRIEHWNGEYFEHVMLKSIGLHVQLNHTSMRCRLPVPAHQEFKVLHGNGIHHVMVDYCGCECWFSATQHIPQMAVSFQLLEFLHILSLCSKISLYNFYQTLEKLTMNTGMGIPKSHSKALIGHIDDGVDIMQPHDLAVLCPSCPQPGINLPEGWEEAPTELRFLYVLLLCMDANFWLKNQIASSYFHDPGLSIGWGYFVPRKPYNEYVLNHTSDEDISTCVGFAALAKQDTKFLKGLRYTGVGAVSCARGEFLIWLVNLHKGERYASMDYIFGSVLLSFVDILLVIISYAIACQWFVNLKTHMKMWPSEIPVPAKATLSPAIPKFHEPAHKQENHQEFACGLIKGMGNSDCKVPEHIWGPNNAFGNSTKTMGPGLWQDVLKYMTMGRQGIQHHCAVLIDYARFDPVSKICRCNQRKKQRICAEWEDAPFPKKVENPFAVNQDYMSEEEVEKELEAEEEEHCQQGGCILHTTSADKFMVLALALEESHWLVLCVIYVPGLVQYLSEVGEPSGEDRDDNSEDIKLWLPSSLPDNQQRAVCMEGLPCIEERLHMAQCHDTLNGIQHTLYLKTWMIHFCNKNTCGQAPSMRARSVIDGIHHCALGFATKYQIACAAKLELASPDIRSYTDLNNKKWGTDQHGNNEDEDEPIHMSNEEEEELNLEAKECTQKEGTGETCWTLSWIWQTTTINIEDGTNNNEEILHAEWCKSQAWAKRSSEEKAEWWEEQRASRDVRGDEGLAEGLQAFAQDQKELQRKLKSKFEAVWKTPLEEVK